MLALTAAPAATAAPAEDLRATQLTSDFESQDCTQQVLAIASKKGISDQEAAREADKMCNATVTVEVSDPKLVSVPEAKREAASLGLDAA
ncbi:hypothetical protein FDK12_11980 [Arthrobacter sp. NamB2]|nr:hypothetical protein FDK12_11980 [Arthrobacter sp. NamB2]